MGSPSHDSNPGSEVTVSTQETPDSHTFQEPEVSTEQQGCGAPNTQPWKTSAQGLAFQPTSAVFTFPLSAKRHFPCSPGQASVSQAQVGFGATSPKVQSLWGDRAACSEGDSVPTLAAHWEGFLLIATALWKF